MVLRRVTPWVELLESDRQFMRRLIRGMWWNGGMIMTGWGGLLQDVYRRDTGVAARGLYREGVYLFRDQQRVITQYPEESCTAGRSESDARALCEYSQRLIRLPIRQRKKFKP